MGVLFGRVICGKEEDLVGVIKEIHQRNDFGIMQNVEIRAKKEESDIAFDAQWFVLMFLGI